MGLAFWTPPRCGCAFLLSLSLRCCFVLAVSLIMLFCVMPCLPRVVSAIGALQGCGGKLPQGTARGGPLRLSRSASFCGFVWNAEHGVTCTR